MIHLFFFQNIAAIGGTNTLAEKQNYNIIELSWMNILNISIASFYP